MLDGLEYYMKRIRNYEKAACRRSIELNSLARNGERFNLPLLSRQTNHNPAVHEVTGYLTRIRQLEYFFKSKWFQKVINASDIASTIPSILALQPLGNKFTAHRQQDYPAHDDCQDLGFNQLGLKHMLTSPVDHPENVLIEYQFPTKQRNNLLKLYHPAPVKDIECLEANNNIVIFTPTKIHSEILKEIDNLLEMFFGFKELKAPH